MSKSELIATSTELVVGREYGEDELVDIVKTYWQKYPSVKDVIDPGRARPELYAITTASIRKAMFVWEYLSKTTAETIDGLDVPEFITQRITQGSIGTVSDFQRQLAATRDDGLQLIEYQRTIEKYIQNGDGALPRDKVLFLGFTNNIPVFCISPEGETDSNHDPVSESKIKATSVLDRWGNMLRIEVIGADTTGLLTHNFSNPEKKRQYDLGKPANLSDYREIVKQFNNADERLPVIQSLFSKWYKLRFYFGSQDESFIDWLKNICRDLQILDPNNLDVTTMTLSDMSLINMYVEVHMQEWLENTRLSHESVIDSHRTGLFYQYQGIEIHVLVELLYQLWSKITHQIDQLVNEFDQTTVFVESGAGGATQLYLFGFERQIEQIIVTIEVFIHGQKQENESIVHVRQSIIEKVRETFQQKSLEALVHTMGAPTVMSCVIVDYMNALIEEYANLINPVQ